MRLGGYNDIPERVDEEELERLQELFVGKSVGKIDKDRLRLSDGTVLRLGGNDGGCACNAGDYELTELNRCENIITNVAVDTYDHGTGWEPDKTYHLFVFADHRKINLATFEGTDGNGYYGTGFWVEVEPPKGVT